MPEKRSIKAVRGSAVHRSIARIHREKLWSWHRDVYDQEWKEVLEDPAESMLPWSKEEDEESVKEDGAVILGNYCERNKHARVLAVEVPFRTLLAHPRTKTRYRLAGTLDQIREVEGGFEIWDHKTDAAVPDAAYLARNFQFSAYGEAMRSGLFFVNGEPMRLNTHPTRLVWNHLNYLLPYKRATTRDGTKYEKGDLRGDPEIEVRRAPGDYEFWRAEACRLIQIIRMKLWVRMPSKIGCSMCKYQHACVTGQAYQNDPINAVEGL